MLPILRAVADGGRYGYGAVEGRVCREMEIGEPDRRAMSGKKRPIYDRLSWARTYLKQHGLIADTPAAFQITERGRAVLGMADGEPMEGITLRFLEALRLQWGPGPPYGAATLRAMAAEQVARGRELLRMGRAEDALDSFASAAELDASGAEAHMASGHAQVGLGRMRGALASFRRAAAAGAGHEAHTCCGVALLELGRPSAALESFRAALESGAGADAHLGRSRALLGLGRCVRAQRAAELAIAARPGDAAGHIALGRARRGLWDHEGMLAAFGDAVRAEPSSAHAHACMAEALGLLGRRKEARAEAGAARRLAAGGGA